MELSLGALFMPMCGQVAFARQETGPSSYLEKEVNWGLRPAFGQYCGLSSLLRESLHPCNREAGRSRRR